LFLIFRILHKALVPSMYCESKGHIVQVLFSALSTLGPLLLWKHLWPILLKNITKMNKLSNLNKTKIKTSQVLANDSYIKTIFDNAEFKTFGVLV
jgi:hypothetical protein